MKKKQPRKTPRLYGIGCKFIIKGAIILDGRRNSEKAKFVGIVRPNLTKSGYTLCPFVRKAFIFRTVVPEQFKSPQRAWEWLTHHTVNWTYGEDETSLRPLTDPIIRNRRRYSLLTDFRLRRIVGQVLLGGICAFWTPASIPICILVKMGAIGLVASAAIDTLVIFREYF